MAPLCALVSSSRALVSSRAGGSAPRAAPATPLPAARRQVAARRLRPARAADFNEGAAQVRRLVDRDRKELSLDELEATFAEEAVPGVAAPTSPASAAEADGAATVAPAPPAAAAAAGVKAVSPFQVNSSVAGAGGRVVGLWLHACANAWRMHA